MLLGYLFPLTTQLHIETENYSSSYFLYCPSLVQSNNNNNIKKRSDKIV